MERKNNILTLFFCLVFLCVFNSSFSQEQYSEQIYNAYMTGDMRPWELVITPIWDSKLELAEYYYAHIGYLLGNNNKSQAKTYLSRADDLIETTLKDEPGPPATCLKGIFVAYRKEMNKLKLPVLGPQCMKLIKKSLPDRSRLRAGRIRPGKYVLPLSFGFGGDKALGIQYMREAAGLMEQQGEAAGNWFYLNLLTMIA